MAGKNAGTIDWLLGTLFLALFFADVAAFFRTPPWLYIFWACNHMSLFLAIGFFRRSRYVFTALSSLLLVPQLVWIADFFLHLANMPSFGITDYLFVPNYPTIWFTLSLKHLFLPFVSLLAIYHYGGAHPKAWKAAFAYGAGLWLFSLLLPRSLNINCAYQSCLPAVPMPQIVWFAGMPIVMAALIWLQFSLIRKYLPEKAAKRKQHPKSA